MAGAMRKMGVYLGLVEDDERDDYYDDHVEEERRYERPQPATRQPMEPVARTDVRVPQRRIPAPAAAPTPAPSPVVADPYRIITLHPRTYNEARQIGEEFRQGVPVIMNLTEMDDTDAKRLVDFAAGLVFGCHGAIERVTQKVFLLSPANVDVSAEDKARIASGGFFNQS
ncbi:cell division protein SepF [Sporichthya brevicatena]|uniref:Cell division protein SepF n=1 Tax=Sporichthya brevicatena TaxID=171442 RepID=A0ABN1GSW3_9ACTN